MFFPKSFVSLKLFMFFKVLFAENLPFDVQFFVFPKIQNPPPPPSYSYPVYGAIYGTFMMNDEI